MTEKQKDDVFYVCSLIETIARKTKNHRQDVIRHFTKADIERQLRLAEVKAGVVDEDYFLGVVPGYDSVGYFLQQRPVEMFLFLVVHTVNDEYSL